MIEMMAGILSGGDTIAEDHQTDGSAHNHLFALIIDLINSSSGRGERAVLCGLSVSYAASTWRQSGDLPRYARSCQPGTQCEDDYDPGIILVWVVEHYARKGIDLGLHPQESALAG